MKPTVVGKIKFGDFALTVYNSLDEPLFDTDEVAKTLNYYILERNTDNPCTVSIDDIAIIEKDEFAINTDYLTENGLYNLLAQGNTKIAREWRRVVIKQLIDIRKQKKMNIEEQFEEWHHALDDIFFDETTGKLMRSVTVAGGDVIQVEV